MLDQAVTTASDVVESAGSVSATAAVPSSSSSSSSSSGSSSSSSSSSNVTLNGTLGVPLSDAEKEAAQSESYQYVTQLAQAASTLSAAASAGNLSSALGYNVTVDITNAPVVPEVAKQTKNCTIDPTTQEFVCVCLSGYWGITCDKTCDHCTGTGALAAINGGSGLNGQAACHDGQMGTGQCKCAPRFGGYTCNHCDSEYVEI